MRRWLSAVVGVMLAKPLAALVITVGSALMTSQTTSGVGEGSFWDLLVGIAAIYMACYSPKMIMPVVQFLGDDRSMGQPNGMCCSVYWSTRLLWLFLWEIGRAHV